MRKFLSFFNIFELNLTSKSYKSSAIRIICSLIAMASVSIFRLNVTLTNPAVNITVSLLVLLVLICAILCFFVALVECLQVGDNVKKERARIKDYNAAKASSEEETEK